MKYFSMFSGIGAFELAIQQVYGNKNSGEFKNKEPEKGFFPDQTDSSKEGLSSTLIEGMGKGGGNVPLVLDSQKLTNMQSKPTENISQNIKIMEMQQKSLLPNSQSLTCSLRDFLAKVSALLESGEDLKIREALCSLKSPELQKTNDLRIYYLRMSRDFCPTIKVIPLRQSSQQLMNWGMTVNGMCLTARILESPRIGKECSLSDILEESPDQKYFLSEKIIERFLNSNKEFSNPETSYSIDASYYKGSGYDNYVEKKRRQVVFEDSQEITLGTFAGKAKTPDRIADSIVASYGTTSGHSTKIIVKSEYKGLGVHDPNTGEANRVYEKDSKSPPIKTHPVLIMDKKNDK